MRTKFLFVSLVLTTLSACTSVPPASEIPASIANASTAADHQRIADYFARKAAAYDAEAAWHEKMARTYAGRPRSDYASMASHCHSLRDKFSSAAKEARELEQGHRQMASSAGQ